MPIITSDSRFVDASNITKVDVLTDLTVLNDPKADIRSARQIVTDIETGNIHAAIAGLRQLSKKSIIFSRKWLWKQALALEKRDWQILSKGFIEKDFVGTDSYFLLIAPYKVLREGTESIELTAILGKVSDRPDLLLDKPENFLQQEFGVLGQTISEILPYEQIAACGQAEGENNEAFIVPNNWLIPHSVNGPSLNNMTEQRRRFRDSGQKCIEKIFEPDTAKFLLAPLQDLISGNYYRNLEYWVHSGAGHCSGWGLKYKIAAGVFDNSSWSGSIEEARADGMGLEFATNILPAEDSGKVAAVNFCVRLALDAHRHGGLNRDGDVGAALMNFAHLCESGELCIKEGRLAFRELTYPALLRATKPLRDWAVKFTREELRLDDAQGLFRLHTSVGVSPFIKDVFLGLIVDPCKGFYSELR
jgi:Family of unknown function (DUF6014)